MIRSFRSKDAAALFHDVPVRRFQAFERPARRKLLDLQSDYELRVARQTTWTRVEPTVQTRVA